MLRLKGLVVFVFKYHLMVTLFSCFPIPLKKGGSYVFHPPY